MVSTQTVISEACTMPREAGSQSVEVFDLTKQFQLGSWGGLRSATESGQYECVDLDPGFRQPHTWKRKPGKGTVPPPVYT